MKDKIFGVLQRVGRSFMLPIALLPVAGILLGLGSVFTNETTLSTYHLTAVFGEGTFMYGLNQIFNAVGSAVFNNLAVLFAVGVAIGMAKKEKEVAALAGLIGYIVMNTSINAMMQIMGQIDASGNRLDSATILEGSITTTLGITSLQMGVFGGIIVGLGAAALHNKFYKIKLPNAISFFGGSRFVPIITTITYTFVGILMYFVWPYVGLGINALGTAMSHSGYLGTRHQRARHGDVALRLSRNARIWYHQARADSVRSPSRLLSSVLADSSRRHGGHRRRQVFRRPEHLLRGAGSFERDQPLQRGRVPVFLR